jgi:hypothetical protein
MATVEDIAIDISLNINSFPTKPDDLRKVSVHVLNVRRFVSFNLT